MNHFLEIYGTLPRAGPGSFDCTRRAYGLLQGLPPEPRILDLGCGPGAQTVDLLKLSAGSVVALDMLPEMVARARENADSAGVADRLQVLQQDMGNMAFRPASFDIVWSEGAIYNLGFESGLGTVWPLVRPGGCVAVSEVIWLQDNPSDEVVDFWQEYPEIDTIENKRAVIARLGYELLGDFRLPTSAWTDQYYDPMERRVTEKAAEWAGDAEAQAVLAVARAEIALYRRYSDEYGYAFFVMRRPAD